MTRLEAEATMQSVPLAPEAAAWLTPLVAPAPPGARMVDVCAGEGDAAAMMAAAWGIDRSRLCLNEPHDGRRARCARFSDRVLGADAIRTLQAGRHMFQAAWTNPPFGGQARAHGGGRLEPLFFRRIVEEGRWLQPGGVHLMLAPQDVWAESVQLINHLARCYDQVTILALPTAHRRCREALVVGVVRAVWRAGAELRAEALRLKAQFLDAVSDQLPAPLPRYRIPAPDARAGRLVWRDLAAATPEQALDDVLTGGGAWSARAAQEDAAAARQPRPRIRPLFPLGKAAAALRIAHGDVNNMVITLDGRRVRIKGGTRVSTRTWTVERVTPDGAVILETHRADGREPLVTTMDVATGRRPAMSAMPALRRSWSARRQRSSCRTR